MVFIAGSMEQTGAGIPFVAALSFDESLGLIEVQKIDDNPRLGTVSCMRRSTRGDALFLGTYEYVVVMLYLNNRFYFLQEIMNNTPNPVMDICYHEGILYSVSDSQLAMAVHFNDRILQNRQLSNSKVSQPVEELSGVRKQEVKAKPAEIAKLRTPEAVIPQSSNKDAYEKFLHVSKVLEASVKIPPQAKTPAPAQAVPSLKKPAPQMASNKQVLPKESKRSVTCESKHSESAPLSATLTSS